MNASDRSSTAKEYREIALDLDMRERPVEAAWAYEIAIKQQQADAELFINLAALYMEMTDTGYYSHHRIDGSIVGAAVRRGPEVLAEAKDRFGSITEIEFWQLYFGWFVYGKDVSKAEMQSLIDRGDSLMPYYFLHVTTERGRYPQEMEQLMTEVRPGLTERSRFIRSILEASKHQASWELG